MTDDADHDLALIERWRDAALSAVELDALRARMRDDPAFRARFVDEARFHGMLAGLLGDDGPALLTRVENAIAGSRPSGLHRLVDTVERRVERSHPRPPGGATRAFTRAGGRRSPTMRRIGVALAALVVIAVVWTMQAPRSATIARVAAASAATLDRAGVSRSLGADEAIQSGDVVTTAAGSATIAYADGTRIDLAADSTAAFAAGAVGKRIRLDHGVARASVARQPAGAPLEIATPHAAIVVVGTRFTLGVAPSGTDLTVDEGRVALLRGGERREVAAGEIARADGDGIDAWPISPQALARERDAIIAAIAPDAEDGRLFAIPWETDLQAARRRAAAQDKPLLMWAGWGHPFGMGNAETVTARRVIAVDARFQAAVAGRFVPVVVDPWVMIKRDDDAGRFYRAAIASAGRTDTTNDGFFVVGADGRALASCVGVATVEEVLAMLGQGAAAHAGRGAAIPVDGARDAALDHQPPAGGLVLALRARRLVRSETGWRAEGGIGRDHLWLSADHRRALVGDGRTGTRHALDPVVARHIARHAVADTTIEEWPEWDAAAVEGLAIDCEVVERSATRVRVRLSGRIALEERARSCRLALIGEIVAEGGAITRCDLLGVGAFRDAAGERVVGVHGAIAAGAPGDRVPPHGLRDRAYLRRE
ncbi:MAG TPA: FecR family protein [Planctomycetota bacterium]|nr:FecR family protein [Planctomycetota bacterium]